MSCLGPQGLYWGHLELISGLLPHHYPVFTLWTLVRSLLGLDSPINNMETLSQASFQQMSKQYSILPKRILKSERTSNLLSDTQDLNPETLSLHFLAAIPGHLFSCLLHLKQCWFQASRCSQWSWFVAICKNTCTRNCVAGTRADGQSTEIGRASCRERV